MYEKLLPIMAMSALGAVPDDLDFDFNPVRRPDENEMSDLASKNTDSVTKAFQAGLISQRTALKELRAQSEITGMWTNITDEDIEKADDTIQDPNEGKGDMGGLFGEEDQSTQGNKPENGEKNYPRQKIKRLQDEMWSHREQQMQPRTKGSRVKIMGGLEKKKTKRTA